MKVVEYWHGTIKNYRYDGDISVDYSLLIVVATGMMKMATGDKSPLRQDAGTGSRLVSRGYRALQRRNF